MDLYQIRYFLAVVETGNFSRAAERAFVSQPTLSAGIKKLEQELGRELFVRNKRGITLTEAGNRFLPHARTIIYECNTAKTEITGRENTKRLRLGIHRVLPIEHICQLMADFKKNHSNVQIALKEGNSDQLEKWLGDGRIDLALDIAHPLSGARRFEKLFTTKCLLAVSKTHPFISRNSITLEELDKLEFVHRSHCITETEVTRTFARAGIRPQIVLRTDEDSKAKSLVSSGLGICMMPDILGSSEISLLEVEGISINRNVGLNWNADMDTEVSQSFRLFATSHKWYARNSEPSNLEWAR